MSLGKFFFPIDPTSSLLAISKTIRPDPTQGQFYHLGKIPKGPLGALLNMLGFSDIVALSLTSKLWFERLSKEFDLAGRSKKFLLDCALPSILLQDRIRNALVDVESKVRVKKPLDYDVICKDIFDPEKRKENRAILSTAETHLCALKGTVPMDLASILYLISDLRRTGILVCLKGPFISPKDLHNATENLRLYSCNYSGEPGVWDKLELDIFDKLIKVQPLTKGLEPRDKCKRISQMVNYMCTHQYSRETLLDLTKYKIEIDWIRFGRLFLAMAIDKESGMRYKLMDIDFKKKEKNLHETGGIAMADRTGAIRNIGNYMGTETTTCNLLVYSTGRKQMNDIEKDFGVEISTKGIGLETARDERPLPKFSPAIHCGVQVFRNERICLGHNTIRVTGGNLIEEIYVEIIRTKQPDSSVITMLDDDYIVWLSKTLCITSPSDPKEIRKSLSGHKQPIVAAFIITSKAYRKFSGDIVSNVGDRYVRFNDLRSFSMKAIGRESLPVDTEENHVHVLDVDYFIITQSREGFYETSQLGIRRGKSADEKPTRTFAVHNPGCKDIVPKAMEQRELEPGEIPDLDTMPYNELERFLIGNDVPIVVKRTTTLRYPDGTKTIKVEYFDHDQVPPKKDSAREPVFKKPLPKSETPNKTKKKESVVDLTKEAPVKTLKRLLERKSPHSAKKPKTVR